MKNTKTITSTKTASITCYCKLTRKNPRVEVANRNGQTAVHLLARRGAVDVMETLIRKGVDINKRDSNGETFLYHGLSAGIRYEALVKLYRQNNGDLNLVNKQGVS